MLGKLHDHRDHVGKLIISQLRKQGDFLSSRQEVKLACKTIM
jgi:hypothetical protein